MSANVPAYFICPISKQIMEDPVIWMDGNTYERREIECWLAKHKINTTRSDLAYRNILFPNRGAKAGIEAFLADHGGGGLGKIKASQEESTDIPDEFICPLSTRIMTQPVVCADGVTYERSEIERWLVVFNTSPDTGQVLQHKILTVNDRIRAEMNAFNWRRYVVESQVLSLQLLVKSISGRAIEMEMRSNSLVSDIKKELHRRGEGLPEYLQLMVEGRVLSNEMALRDSSIKMGSTFLFTRADPPQMPPRRHISCGGEIFVVALDGRKFTIEMAPDEMVGEFKQRLYDRGENPPEEQRLVYAGKQLEDGCLFCDYNIQKKSTLHMVLRLRGC